MSQKPTVAILTPCYSHLDPIMQEALLAMARNTSLEVATVYDGTRIKGSSVVHWTRNDLLTELFKSGRPFTHVLFVDSDVVVEKTTLVQLLSRKVDIVGAIYTKRQYPPQPCIYRYNPATSEYEGFTKLDDTQSLLEVDAVGTGCLLLSRTAINMVGNSYLTMDHEREVFGSIIEGLVRSRCNKVKLTKNYWWFRFLPKLNGAEEYGEDISFCLVAQRYCQLKIYVDMAARVGHLGQYPWSIDNYFAEGMNK